MNIHNELNLQGFMANGMLTSLITTPLVFPGYTVCTHFIMRKNLDRLFLHRKPNLSALYSGVFAGAACDLTGQIAAFGAFGCLKPFTPKHQDYLGSIGSGILTSPLINMLERIVILQQINGDSMRETVRKIIRAEGKKGLFKGTSLTAAQEILFQTSLFSSSNQVAKKTSEKKSIPPLLNLFISYTASGVLIGIITSPLQEIKTSFQGKLGQGCIRDSIEKTPLKKRIIQSLKVAGLRTPVLTTNLLTAGILKEVIPLIFPSSLYK